VRIGYGVDNVIRCVLYFYFVYMYYYNNRILTGIYYRQNSVDHVAGPVNGDVYTVVNPSAEKKKNGKVYVINFIRR
jgi:hypothetical protein